MKSFANHLQKKKKKEDRSKKVDITEKIEGMKSNKCK